MKRILALICLLLSFVMTACIFCGCGAANDLLDGSQNLQNNPSTQHVSTQTTPTSIPTAPITEPTQPTTVPTQLEAPGVELEAQADSSVEPYPYPNREGWPKIISSVEELEELANSDIGHTLNYVPDVTERYDESFFEEHTLLLVYLYTDPVSKDYYVSSCLKMADGSYSIVLYGERPFYGDCANMSRYIVTFIAIRDHVPKDAVIQFTILDEDTKLITN